MPPKKRVKEVELLELPDNTPEVVPITCNGILGHFVVRTKTVVDEHFKEHKVTSFAKETGTNNPWKTAMHIATAGAQAGMVMKKWLDQRAITSPLLSELNRNAKEAGWQRPQLPGELACKKSKGGTPRVLQAPEESQASGAPSFLSSSPSKLTQSDMGPPAHKTISLTDITAGRTGPKQQAPRLRIPARPDLGQNEHAGAPAENGDSPAAEQAASCNDAASQAESDCVTPHNPQKGQRKTWASPPGPEASTPGALLYHDRTPASPVNMMLLNRPEPPQAAQAQDAQPPPAPPLPPPVPSSNGGSIPAATQAPAALPASAAMAGPVSTGGSQGTAAGATAPAANDGSSAPQPKAKQPRGKGFAGLPAPVVSPPQTGSLSNGLRTGAACDLPRGSGPAQMAGEPAAAQRGSLQGAPAPPEPSLAARAGSADNGAALKSGRAQQTDSAAQAALKRPSVSSGAPQREQGRASSDDQAAKRQKGLPGQSLGLEGASVHQAVQAVQDIVDAVPDSSTDHALRSRTLSTPDGSPSKQAADASRGATAARKKQHSTPPIKDVRCSSLHDQEAPEKHISNGVINGPAPGSEGRPGQDAGSRGQQGAAAPSAGPAPAAVPRLSVAVTPSSAGRNGPEGSVAAASCSFLLAKRKLAAPSTVDEAELKQRMAKKFRGAQEANKARAVLEAELAELRQAMTARVAALEAERDACAAQAQVAIKEAASGTEAAAAAKAQLMDLEQKLEAASQREAALRADVSKAKQDVLAAKQSMFSRHASTEKALREHKEQLAAAREELASKEGLHQTMKANAANLRAQISSLKKEKEAADAQLGRLNAEHHQLCASKEELQKAHDELQAKSEKLQAQAAAARDEAEQTRSTAAAERDAAIRRLKAEVQSLQAAITAAEARADAKEHEAASARETAEAQSGELRTAHDEAAAFKKQTMDLMEKSTSLDKQMKEASVKHGQALKAAEAKVTHAEEARKLAVQAAKAAEDSRRKAQQELAEARSSEQATQQRGTALTKEVANLKSQIRDREGEHARALLAAKTKAKQAAEEMLKLRESHAAAVDSLHLAHRAALQQQKDALEQALTARMEAEVEEIRKQIRVEVMHEILEDPAYTSGLDE